MPKPKGKIPRAKGKPITCEHCGNQWETRSKYKYVTCPNCLKKTKTPL